jgi:hypothetical protein
VIQAGIDATVGGGGTKLGVAVRVGDGVMLGISVCVLAGNDRGRLPIMQAKADSIVVVKKTKILPNLIFLFPGNLLSGRKSIPINSL